MARAENFFDRYDVGGESKPLTRENLAELIGRMATDESDFGDLGGEYAELPRPFRPPDIGSVALRPPGSEPVLELS